MGGCGSSYEVTTTYQSIYDVRTLAIDADPNLSKLEGRDLWLIKWRPSIVPSDNPLHAKAVLVFGPNMPNIADVYSDIPYSDWPWYFVAYVSGQIQAYYYDDTLPLPQICDGHPIQITVLNIELDDIGLRLDVMVRK
jgi:hypothetical protein